VKLTCQICLKDHEPDRLFKPNGFLSVPILCDVCGVGLLRYTEMRRRYAAQSLDILRQVQTQTLLEISHIEDSIRIAEHQLRREEGKEKRLGRPLEPATDLEADRLFAVAESPTGAQE